MMKKKDDYFLLTWKKYRKDLPFAFSDYKRSRDEIIDEAIAQRRLLLTFELKSSVVTAKGVSIQDPPQTPDWPDYIANNFALPLVSKEMREVIHQNLKKDDDVKWIATRVSNGGIQKDYFLLYFGKTFDVLDQDNTLFDEVGVVRPCFSFKKINRYSIFHRDLNRTITSAIYCSATLKKEIMKQNLIGVTFEKTYVV